MGTFNWLSGLMTLGLTLGGCQRESDAEELARLKQEETAACLDLLHWQRLAGDYNPLIPEDQQRQEIAARDSIQSADIRCDLARRDINRFMNR